MVRVDKDQASVEQAQTLPSGGFVNEDNAGDDMPAPEVLRAGPKPPVQPAQAPRADALAIASGPQADIGPGPDRFRPARGLNPIVFLFPSLMFGGLWIAITGGWFAFASMAQNMDMIANVALGLSELFALLLAWSLGDDPKPMMKPRLFI
jgi:hypothetical protein